MESKLKNLAVRVLSGIVLAVVVLGCIYGSYWSFGLLLFVITMGGVREFYRLATENGANPLVFSGYAAAAAIFAFGFDYFYNGSLNNIYLSLFLMLVIPMMFVVELLRGGDRPFVNIGSTILALTYIAVPMAMLSGVPLLITGGEWDPMVMVFYMFIIWGTDSFAYLVGVSCGRNRLYEKISPLKSWEGFFGGVIGAIGISLLAAYVLGDSYVMWGCMGVVISLTGCLGDLVESMFKRKSGVKDSGHVLPGHGGWLDRFDSLIFSAPFVLVFLIIYSQL